MSAAPGMVTGAARAGAGYPRLAPKVRGEEIGVKLGKELGIFLEVWDLALLI